MAASQIECSRLEQRSVIKLLTDECVMCTERMFKSKKYLQMG